MITLEGIYINIFASIIGSVLLIALLLKKAYVSYRGSSITKITAIAIILNAIEGITLYFDGRIELFYRALNYGLTWWGYILTPILIAIWGLYIHRIVLKKQVSKQRTFWYFLPVVFVVIVLTISIFYPIVFTFNSGYYERGQWYYVVSFVSYLNAVYVVGELLYHARKINTQSFVVALSSLLLPMGLGIFQIFHQGVITINPFIIVSVLIVYAFYETKGVYRDELTGALTRTKIYDVIESYILSKQNFIVTLLDMDNLKQFNDQHGHLVGDLAITTLINSINSQCSKDCLIGRLGGDEFIILRIDKRKDEVIEGFKALKATFNYENETYNVDFSFGVSEKCVSDTKTIDNLIYEADREMYKMKEKHKIEKVNA